MKAHRAPLLAQFALAASSGANVLDVEVNSATGLLHKSGEAVPLIEALIAESQERRQHVEMQTFLTESSDPVDPDVVRADSTGFRVGLESALTRAQIDPADPDLIRANNAWQEFEAATQSGMTKAEIDPPDPDFIRAQSHRGMVDSLITNITKSQFPDPDAIRVESYRAKLASD